MMAIKVSLSLSLSLSDRELFEKAMKEQSLANIVDIPLYDDNGKRISWPTFLELK